LKGQVQFVTIEGLDVADHVTELLYEPVTLVSEN
jgi:hypothetical protein